MYFKRCKQNRLLTLIVWIGLALIGACDDSKSNNNTQDANNEEAAGEIVGGSVAGSQMMAGDEQDAGNEETAGELQAGEIQAGETQAGEVMSGPRPEKLCPQSIAVDCNFGRQQVDTAQGNADINQYTCAEGFNFPGQELLFEFLEEEAQQVQIRVRQLYTQFAVSYIFFALEGQTDSCEPEQAQCYAQDTLLNDLIILDYVPNKPMWFSIDPRINATETAIFELDISCINSRCGDGVIDERESCDDGNLSSGDGCDNECQTEVNYICSGAPSVCVLDAGNDDCEEVITATSGTYMGDTRGCTSDYAAISGGCGNQSNVSGPDQSYVIDVPANKVLRANIDTVQESGFNAPKLWLAVDTEQAADTCVQQSSEELFWLNGGDAEQQVILTVDGVSVNDQGVYRLNVDFLTPPSRLGSSCAQAIEVGSGTYMGDTSGDGLPSNLHGGVGGECIRTGGFWGYNGGPDETYKVTLQPNQRLSAVANEIGNWDHVLSIHNSCGDLERSCLQWDDYGRASVTNETGQAQDYYIMVGGFYNYSSGEYTLDITIE